MKQQFQLKMYSVYYNTKICITSKVQFGFEASVSVSMLPIKAVVFER